MRKLLGLLLLIPVLCSVNGFSQSTRGFEKIEKRINSEIAAGSVPSMAVAVMKDGKIIYEKAFGWADLGAKVKSTIHTAYQLASVSKPMTATGLMRLQHQGIVNIDSPATRYMGRLKFKEYAGKASHVTLRHLLNHTSGLGTYFDIGYADENRQADKFVAGFNKYGSLFHPAGMISEYSNLGYGLLDYIIARQSGKTFDRFMEEEVFRPLGMSNTFVQGTNCPGIKIARKYDADLKLLPGMLNNTTGAGNIYSSIHDLALFGMFHLNNSGNYHKPILTQEEINSMHYYRDNNALYHYYDAATYGLGWYYKPGDNGYRVVWHEGGMLGVNSVIKLFPDQHTGIAVIVNSSNRSLVNEIAEELSKLVLPGYQPTPLNEDAEVANYRPYTSDPSYIGNWKGTIRVENLTIPCSLRFDSAGTVVITYLDYTYRSYFTQGNPLPHKTILLAAIINQNSFIGMFPGVLPSGDIRREFSQILSLKLYKEGKKLSGTIVALAAASREYYAYPFHISLEKE